MMLKDKVAVIYGAGGAIGSAVARAFASERADLFLTGRHMAPVSKPPVRRQPSNCSVEPVSRSERDG